MYLVTCRRVCFLCFTENVDFLPLSRNDRIWKLGLDSENLAKLPSLQSIPGCYSSRKIKWRRREVLYDYSAAREAGITVHGSISSMEEYTSKVASKKLAAFNTKRSLHKKDGPKLRPPRTEDFLIEKLLILGASLVSYVLRSSILKRHPQIEALIVSPASLYIIVDHSTGVESTRWSVFRIISRNVGK